MNRNNSESVARADPGFRVLGLRYILQKKKKIVSIQIVYMWSD